MLRFFGFVITVMILMAAFSAAVYVQIQADAQAQIIPVDEDTVCYRGAGEKVKPVYEIDNILVSVNWFDDLASLREDLKPRVSFDVTDTEGYSECLADEAKNLGWCEIWVVRPTYVYGDPHMDTLGHEVLHGLMGAFHE